MAIVAIMLAAVGAGIGFALLVSGPTDPDIAASTTQPAAASASASAAASASAPEEANPSAAATPTPPPTPEPNPVLANRSIADVSVDQLNVRSAGNGAAEILGQLRAGARVFTIGAPESAEGMYWYRVAVASGPYSDGECNRNEYCVEDIGWVASPITGDPWLEEVDLGCPTSPMTAQQLAQLTPLERLHCYGNQEIVVTGTIDHPCCGYVGPVRHEPAWLAVPGSSPYFHEAGFILFRSDPADGLDLPARGDVVQATAHFDDPAAPSCRQSIDSEFADETPPDLVEPVAEVVLICRTQLVVTSFEVIGTEDLGPCCGLAPDAVTVGRRPVVTEGT